MKRTDLDGDMEERQPLNAMVAENLKNAIIRKIYKDAEKKVVVTDAFSPVLRQYFLALGPSFAALCSGMTAGFSAVLLPQLERSDSILPITQEEGSWIASMAALPMMVGCLCSSYPMDKFGRKLAVIMSAVVFAIGWATLALSTDVLGLYIGRFLTGFSVGLMSPMCQVYIAETSDPEHRGILLSSSPLSVAIGILVVHLLGTYLPWSTTAWICGLPTLLCVLSLLLVPESPLWLLSQGKTTEADSSYKWFHGTSERSLQEWANIIAKGKESLTENTEPPSKFSLMKRPSFLKPFAVLNAFFFVQQFSGVNAVAFYSVSILKEVIPTIDEYLATIVIDVVRFVISVGGVLMLKKIGRKTLAIASAIGTAVSLFMLSIYLATAADSSSIVPIIPANVTNVTGILEQDGLPIIEVEGFTPLHCVPLLCLVLYICFVSIGIVPIPWILTGELFSKDLRGIGSGVTSSFGFICYFTVVKTSPQMFGTLGKPGTFSLFGCICIVGSVVLALFLPETKDKTLLEIEAFYENPKGNVKDAENVVSCRL